MVHASPGLITYQAKIFKPDGTPLNEPNVIFYFQIQNADGSTNNFTAVGGAGSNYQFVNTASSDFNTYVQSNITNDKDLYQLDDLLLSSATVYGVMVRALAKQLDSGARTQQL